MHRDIVARHLNGATDEFTDPFIFFGDSIQPRSYLFYPEPLMSRAPRAWWLCTGVVRFDSVPAPAPPPILSAKGGQACTSISRGFLKIEWAAGRGQTAHFFPYEPLARKEGAVWMQEYNSGCHGVRWVASSCCVVSIPPPAGRG